MEEVARYAWGLMMLAIESQIRTTQMYQRMLTKEKIMNHHW